MRRTNMEAEIWQREVTQDEEAWRLVRVSVRDARSGTLNRGQIAMKVKYEYKVLQVESRNDSRVVPRSQPEINERWSRSTCTSYRSRSSSHACTRC